ncbi:MAG: Gfo/Idh/MocA family oxidoreductase [Eubacteriales bacterium]
MKQLRLGIIGYGNMGRFHHNNILEGKCPEITVTAIAEPNKARLKAVKEKEKGEKLTAALFESHEELIKSGLADAVVIATPHYFHPQIAIDCLTAGLHVMVEKPAGVYTKNVRQLNETAARSGLVFGMMFNQRTNHVYRKLRELVKSGDFGNIRRSNWIITDWYRPQAYYDSGAWRATWAGEGGGVLLNQCPHQLDLWQWICGMPIKIKSHMAFGKWHDIEVEDEVTAYAEYADGSSGVFVTSTGDACGTNRLEIQMDKAKFVVEGGKLYGWELFPAEQEFSATNKEPFGTPEVREMEIVTDNLYTGHVGVLNAFADAINHGRSLVAGGGEGINGLLISNAMHLSAWTGGEVEIPFDEDEYYRLLMERVAGSRVAKKPQTFTQADISGTF